MNPKLEFADKGSMQWPGSTHHGRPMEVVKMGRTELPLEVILEFLESLKQVYTVEVRCPANRSVLFKLTCV